MTKTDLIEAYKSCLENGWVHNTPEDNIFFDYNYRQKLFNTHLKKIKDHVNNKGLNTIHILIGEAPPYYPNDNFPLKDHRTYFYDPGNSMNTPYFKKPYNHFKRVDTNRKKKTQIDGERTDVVTLKQNYLNDLAGWGVMIFDIFPFPIFQTTKNRQRVNRKSVMNTQDILDNDASKTAFNVYLNNYFCGRLKELLGDFKGKKVEYKYYLFAPKYTSIQFLSWCYSGEDNCMIKDKLVKFSELNDIVLNSDQHPIFTTDIKEFMKKIGNEESIKRAINTHPIFMDNSGNPNFNNFINGMKTNNEFFIKKIE